MPGHSPFSDQYSMAPQPVMPSSGGTMGRTAARESEPEPELEPEAQQSWRRRSYAEGRWDAPTGQLDGMSSDEELPRSEYTKSERRGELGSLSIEALKARAREMRYVNEETLAAVDGMASPKRYLIDLLTLTLEDGAQPAHDDHEFDQRSRPARWQATTASSRETRGPELWEAHPSGGSSSNMHWQGAAASELDGFRDPELSEAEFSDTSPFWHRAAAPERDGFRDPELSEAEFSDTSPFWHRAEPPSRRHAVVSAPPAAAARPEREPALRRVSFDKAKRKYDEAMKCLRNPRECERAMTLLESALHLLGPPWDHASQELGDLIRAEMNAVPRRYLSDELQARSARQRDWDYDLREVGRFAQSPDAEEARDNTRMLFASPPLGTGGGGHGFGVERKRVGVGVERQSRKQVSEYDPHSFPTAGRRSPSQGSRTLTTHSPQRAKASSPRQRIQDACEQAELEKNEGEALYRQRDFEQALRRYDAALKLLEEVHADDKRCADMMALLQRKREVCSHTLLQQAGSSKAKTLQVSPKSGRHVDSQMQLELDRLLGSAEKAIARTRTVLTEWKKHMGKAAKLYKTGEATDLRRQRPGAQQSQAVVGAERKYTAAVEALNCGDDRRAVELIEASTNMLLSASEGSPDQRVQNLRQAVEEFQQDMEKQQQLLLRVRTASKECQAIQERISSQVWNAVAAASRPVDDRVRNSPGRGGVARWNATATQHAVATTRTGLLASVKEASDLTDTRLSRQQTRLKEVRETLDSLERVLRSALTRRRRGAKHGRASSSPGRGAAGGDGAGRVSPRRHFSTGIGKHDLSTSPTGHSFTVPPPFSAQKQIITTMQEKLQEAIGLQKVYDHANAYRVLEEALQQLPGQPWGGESKRLQEEIMQRQRASRLALDRAGTSRRSRSPRAASPSSSRRVDSRRVETRESPPRKPAGDRLLTRDMQVRSVSFSDDAVGQRTRLEEEAYAVSRSGHQRPPPADTAQRKYAEAEAAFARDDLEDALELVGQGLEILGPASFSDRQQVQQLRSKMETFRREKELMVQMLRQRQRPR
eukprot:COSAG02_NODE_699_length_18369_cov_9.690203_10_plen_1050_part_00